ncbi:MAG: hypothetical protein MUO23_05800 [Anaerolineales bacterium]|nr:hypothetical protein [Anaerolineales bacterium]
MRSSAWIAWVLGGIVGLLAGVFYAWRVNPVSYTQTDPTSLRADFRMDYLALIASAHAGTGDLARAQARLAVFGAEDLAQTLGALAQQRLASGYPEAEARALAGLAAALGERPGQPAIGTPGPAPGTPTRQATPTLGPSRTPQASSTRAPTSTPGAPFQLTRQEVVCEAEAPQPRLQVQIVDASGRGVPAMEIRVVWDQGSDRFVTGLKPELGAGYADFTLEPGIAYTVELPGSSALVTGLKIETCSDPQGQEYEGSWLLVFSQPAG